MRRTRLWQVRLAYVEQYQWSTNRLVGREWSQTVGIKSSVNIMMGYFIWVKL